MTRVSFLTTNGSHTWFGAAAYAKQLGGRLPTHQEIKDAIQHNHQQPLFHTDIWVPVVDAPGTWVSVGSYDPHARLGKSHTELFGVPGWSESPDRLPHRERVAIVSGTPVFIPSDGTLSWSAAKALAETQGAKLASKDEVRNELAANKWQPLFNHDVWVPVRDEHGGWVSVGNYEPAARLGRTHTELFGLPGWSEDHQHHPHRSHIALTFRTAITLIKTNGDVAYSSAVALATAYGARLPTHGEVRALIEHRNGPVVNEDLWLPVIDAPDTWVSAGNYDPSSRLGKTHTELWGVPPWSEDRSPLAHRGWLGLVFSHKRRAQTPVVFSRADGTHSWEAAVALAASIGGRLPSVAEVRQALALNNNQPLFQEDTWVPVLDAPATWVSVGNYDPHTRLGKTHTELFGAPAWSTSRNVEPHRMHIGYVFGQTVFTATHGSLGWHAAAEFARANGAALPTVADIKGAIARNENKPLFHEDIWIPASDAPGTWVSAGNYDPPARLGRTHTELWGVPAWSEDGSALPHRRRIGLQFFA